MSLSAHPPCFLVSFPIGPPTARGWLMLSLLVTEHAPGRLEAMIGVGDGSFGGPAQGLVGTDLGEHPTLASAAAAAQDAVALWRRGRERPPTQPDQEALDRLEVAPPLRIGGG